MKTFKIVIGILVLIPLGLIVASIADPKLLVRYPDLEWIFILIGVPSAVLNLWAWDAPHIIRTIFNLNERK